jgi:hypothetical protein
MPKHKFTLSEQLRATERALSNPNTPRQLVDSLRLRAGKLRKQIAKQEDGGHGLWGLLRVNRRQK